MENELRKKEYYGQLLLIYGNLLTKNIHHRMELFYLNDYSITEISQNEEVSRNAVFESLANGEKQLDKYEKSLKLFERNQRILSIIERMESEEDKEKLKEEIRKLKGEIGYGI
jgi:uncharacterized protein